jgi:ketosteroid isomerase-like protein
VTRQGVELVWRYIDAANQRDFPAAMAAYAEDVVLVVEPRVMPTNAGTVNGREAVGDWFADWFRSFAPGYRFEIDEITAAGERVFMVARHHGHGRASGVSLDWSVAYAFTVRADKIVRLELYAERADAARAAGLEE